MFRSFTDWLNNILFPDKNFRSDEPVPAQVPTSPPSQATKPPEPAPSVPTRPEDLKVGMRFKGTHTRRVNRPFKIVSIELRPTSWEGGEVSVMNITGDHRARSISVRRLLSRAYVYMPTL